MRWPCPFFRGASISRRINCSSSVAKIDGRDKQLAESILGGVAGEVVEEVGAVLADGFVAGEESDVGVELRGDSVVVAGGEMNVAANAILFLADHQRGFAMHLEVHQAIDDVDAFTLQPSGPFDIALFVETRFEFDQNCDLLAIVDGIEQGLDHGSVAADAIESDLDGEHVRIARRLLQKRDNGLERIEGVVQENILTTNSGENVLALVLRLQRRGTGSERMAYL